MKQLLYALSTILLSSVIISCTQESEKQAEIASINPVTAVEASAQTPSETDIQEIDYQKRAKECEAHWAKWQKLNDEKADYFEKSVLPKALANPELPEQNKQFLLALKAYLRQSQAEARKVLTPDQLLFPVFKIKEGELGIIGFPKHDTSDDSFKDISAEGMLLNQHSIKTKLLHKTEPKLVYHETFAESLFSRFGKQVYTFTTQKPVKTQLQNFGTYTGECLEYYNYLLDEKPYSNNDRVLFGSKYNLKLVYKNNPNVDATLVSQLKTECADCPSSMALEKTFASLKGVDGLYFIYADTFPLNNKLETPSRGLLMKMGDKIIYLWHDMIDLVGCSCI